MQLADSITQWFKSTGFYDYFNWFLSQPSNDSFGILLVVGVLLVSVVIVVGVSWK